MPLPVTMDRPARRRLRRLQEKGHVPRGPMPPSARRPGKSAPHTRQGPQMAPVGRVRCFAHDEPLGSSGRLLVWHTTRRSPLDRRADNRRRNRVARQSRKANRHA